MSATEASISCAGSSTRLASTLPSGLTSVRTITSNSVSSFSIGVLLVHAFDLSDSVLDERRPQGSGGAHFRTALEAAILVVCEARGLVYFPTKRIDGQEQTALAFLIVNARRMDAEKIVKKLG